MLQQTAEHTLTLLLSTQEKKSILALPGWLIIVFQNKGEAEKANMVLLCNHKGGDVGFDIPLVFCLKSFTYYW